VSFDFPTIDPEFQAESDSKVEEGPGVFVHSCILDIDCINGQLEQKLKQVSSHPGPLLLFTSRIPEVASHSSTMTTSQSPSERSYILTGLAHPTQPTRLDGRELRQSRPISISYGDAPQASGSARVVLGGTEVLAGIRLEVGEEGENGRCRVEVDV
jgi:exosome complex component RRP42